MLGAENAESTKLLLGIKWLWVFAVTPTYRVCTLEKGMKPVKWPCPKGAESLVQRWMDKHIPPYDIKTVLWQLCTCAVGMHKRGTWPYPGARVSQLSLKPSPSELRRRLRKRTSGQRQLEHPDCKHPELVQQVAWLLLGIQEHLVWVWMTWASFGWACSSWWYNHRALGIWIQWRPGPGPYFLPFKVNLVFICSFFF